MSQQIAARRHIQLHGHGRYVVLAAALLAVMALFTGFSTAKSTYLISDGDLIYTVEGYSGDISEAFIRAGIVLGEDDSVSVREDGNLVRINVTRTVTTGQESTETIPYETIRQANPELSIGMEQVIQQGAAGLRKVYTETKATEGQNPVESFMGVSLTEAVPQIIEYGTGVTPVAQSSLSVTDDVLVAVDAEAGALTTASGQVLPYSQVLDCTATAYTTELQAWKITATGTTARVGAIAVDPKIIPYGSTLYIVTSDGSITYGIATAEDCGGAIKGNKIDLFFDTYDECINFGRRACTVYVLN